MVHACVERLNLLLAEVRPTWIRNAQPSPQEVDNVLTEIHDEYQSGVLGEPPFQAVSLCKHTLR
jgi:hypothetical protein